jgi:hypothetical protein
MSDLKLEKAQLWEMEDDFKKDKSGGKRVTVQFNPESLKVSFANQIEKGDGAGDQKGTPAIQFVGAGTTKLSLQLWFDVSQPISEAATPKGEKDVKDVRKLTQEVAFFITPIEDAKKKFKPPATRFLWGSFQFDGIVESLEETLEFFSPEGRPLRASVSLNLTSQRITKFAFNPVKDQPGTGRTPPPGTKPLTQAPAGSTVQGLADGQGKGNNWQSIAAANGIENPRMLQPGQLLDMDASIGISSGASIGANVGAGGVSAGASVSGQVSLGG